MCEFHLRSSEMCTPKYLICGTEEREYDHEWCICAI